MDTNISDLLHDDEEANFQGEWPTPATVLHFGMTQYSTFIKSTAFKGIIKSPKVLQQLETVRWTMNRVQELRIITMEVCIILQ